MDSRYRSTVLQRPAEDEEERVRRERMDGASNSNTRPYHARSPTQTEFHPPYSPTNGHPRPQFNNPYHPPTPAPLPMPTIAASHIPGPPASPRALTTPYSNDYSSTPREKPTSNYYDPTSDSSERRPSDNSSWHEAQSHTPQVRTQ